MNMLINIPIEVKVMPSMTSLFWWDVVEVYKGRVISRIEGFRSEEQAIDYVTENYTV